ncbi:MAG: hypothetical protein LBB26_01030 [Puniceicoccales bacterium]|jgi:hypothetical protein|nr:hypothetical protein [Puniceicoccales bacterium]
MKSTTDTAADKANIPNGDWKLQMFSIPELTPGSKLEPPFLWEFLAFLGRASPQPAAKTIGEISP